MACQAQTHCSVATCCLQLRIGYAGRELGHGGDDKFHYIPDCPVVHVLRRMNGGAAQGVMQSAVVEHVI